MNEIGLVGVVRCKKCARRYTKSCPMRFEEQVEVDEYGEHDYHTIVHDYTVDFGFCYLGERCQDGGMNT